MWALFCACLAQPQPEVASECDYGDPTSPLEWIDLRRWTEEPPPSLKTGIGNWTNVTNLGGVEDGRAVFQWVNIGGPTFLMSPDIHDRFILRGSLGVFDGGDDDDMIGFMFGSSYPSAAHPMSWQGVLYDWRKVLDIRAQEGMTVAAVNFHCEPLPSYAPAWARSSLAAANPAASFDCGPCNDGRVYDPTRPGGCGPGGQGSNATILRFLWDHFDGSQARDVIEAKSPAARFSTTRPRGAAVDRAMYRLLASTYSCCAPSQTVGATGESCATQTIRGAAGEGTPYATGEFCAQPGAGGSIGWREGFMYHFQMLYSPGRLKIVMAKGTRDDAAWAKYTPQPPRFPPPKEAEHVVDSRHLQFDVSPPRDGAPAAFPPGRIGLYSLSQAMMLARDFRKVALTQAQIDARVPVCQDDRYLVPRDGGGVGQPVAVGWWEGVLGNDYDPNLHPYSLVLGADGGAGGGSPPTLLNETLAPMHAPTLQALGWKWATEVTLPTQRGGSLLLRWDGSFRYSPPSMANIDGVDRVTYRLVNNNTDGAGGLVAAAKPCRVTFIFTPEVPARITFTPIDASSAPRPECVRRDLAPSVQYACPAPQQRLGQLRAFDRNGLEVCGIEWTLDDSADGRFRVVGNVVLPADHPRVIADLPAPIAPRTFAVTARGRFAYANGSVYFQITGRYDVITVPPPCDRLGQCTCAGGGAGCTCTAAFVSEQCLTRLCAMSPLSQSRKWGDACDQCTNPTGVSCADCDAAAAVAGTCADKGRCTPYEPHAERRAAAQCDCDDPRRDGTAPSLCSACVAGRYGADCASTTLGYIITPPPGATGGAFDGTDPPPVVGQPFVVRVVGDGPAPFGGGDVVYVVPYPPDLKHPADSSPATWRFSGTTRSPGTSYLSPFRADGSALCSDAASCAAAAADSCAASFCASAVAAAGAGGVAECPRGAGVLAGGVGGCQTVTAGDAAAGVVPLRRVGTAALEVDVAGALRDGEYAVCLARGGQVDVTCAQPARCTTTPRATPQWTLLRRLNASGFAAPCAPAEFAVVSEKWAAAGGGSAPQVWGVLVAGILGMCLLVAVGVAVLRCYATRISKQQLIFDAGAVATGRLNATDFDRDVTAAPARGGRAGKSQPGGWRALEARVETGKVQLGGDLPAGDAAEGGRRRSLDMPFI